MNPETVQITAVKPLGTEIVSCQAPAGLSISEMLWKGPTPARLPYTVLVWVDGRPVPGDALESTRPPAGSLVLVKTFPRGGGSDLFRAVLIIAVIAASIYTMGAASGLALHLGATTAAAPYWAAAAAIAVSTVGSLVINALIPPITPPAVSYGASDLQENPTMWISGSQNQQNPWGTIPSILGRMRTIPFHGTKPYTQILGNDQYYRALYIIGYGPLQITDLKFGETALSSFQDYEVEIRQGYADDPPITLCQGQVDERPLSILLKKEYDWQSQTTEPDIDEFEIHYAFLSGLTTYDNLGNRQEKNVALECRCRKVGDQEWITIGTDMPFYQKDFILMSSWGATDGEGNWIPGTRTDIVAISKQDGHIRIIQGTTAVPEDCFGLAEVTVADFTVTEIVDVHDPAVTGMAVSWVSWMTIRIADGSVNYADRMLTAGKTSQALRRSLSFKVPINGQYVVQMRRITDDNTDTRTVDECHWIVLSSRKYEEPINFPHPLAKVAVKIKATDQMSSNINELNCIAHSIVKDYDPDTDTWIPRATSNPASLYRHILQGPANARPQADPKLDLDGFFEDFWQFCVDHGFQFNAVLSSAESVYEQCRKVCAAGRAAPQRVEGKWAGVIDREQETITGHYTPHNSWGFEFTGEYPKLPHAWRVRFLDETNDYQQLERIVYADGYNEGNATLFEAVTQTGVTSPDQIHRLWRYNYACAKLRAFPFSFYVDWEHLANMRGDLIRCTHYEIMGQVFSGRLKKIETIAGKHVLTLDNAVTMVADKDYMIRVRLATGASVTGEVILDIGEKYIITIDGLLSSAPAAGDLFQFGELDAESIPAIIKEIEPVDKLCARVICLDYAPAVFDADTEEVPEWDPVFNEPTALARSTPPVPQIISGDVDDMQITRKPDGTYIIRIGINYIIGSSVLKAAEYIQVEFRPIGTNAWQITSLIPAQTGIFYLSVELPVQYELRIRSISRLGATSDWSDIYIFDPSDLKTMGPDSYWLIEESDNEIVIKPKAVPPAIEGLIAVPGFRSVTFSWDASKNLYHLDYIFRTKLGAAAWSAWSSTTLLGVIRTLTNAEIDAYGIDVIIYIEVKDRNIWGTTSALAASSNGASEPIRPVELTGAMYQIIPTDSDDNVFANLKGLYDGLTGSGGVTY